MANYYTHMSFTVDLPSEEAAEKAVGLLGEIDERILEPEDADWSGDFASFKQYECTSDLVVEAEGASLWIRDDCGCPNIDLLADYLQLVLKRYHPTGYAGFEWSTDCDRHRLDAFGGGSVFVTAEKQDFVSSWQWLSQQVEAHKGKSAKIVGDAS